MMLGSVLTALYVICTLYAAANGTAEATGRALMEGAQAAVPFVLGIAGGICLWSGVLELLERCGAAGALARALKRPLRRLFPRSTERGEILEALTENLSANLLGLGNAATPLGLEAAKRMSKKTPGTAGDSLCMLVVCNTASIQLIPTTVAAVRLAAGCRTPFDILPAVWVTSGCSIAVGILAAKAMAKLWRDRG